MNNDEFSNWLSEEISSNSLEFYSYDEFRVDDKIGEGAYGYVYCAHNSQDNKNMALKELKTTVSGSMLKAFKNEVIVIKSKKNKKDMILIITFIFIFSFQNTEKLACIKILLVSMA